MNSCSDLYANGDKLKWCAIFFRKNVSDTGMKSGADEKVSVYSADRMAAVDMSTINAISW